MTLDKAIEINTKLERSLAPTMSADGTDAMKLGIEALKRIKYLQGIALYRSDTVLPGETE